MIAALLQIFSDSLLSMNGIAIKQWFQDVARNKENWFALIKYNPPEEDNKADNLITWSTFTTSWLYVTSGA